MRMIISIVLLLASSLSNACTIDANYINENFNSTIRKSSAVFRGSVVEKIGNEPSIEKDILGEVFLSLAKNAPTIQEELLVIEVTESYKGSRSKYTVKASTVCRSFPILVGQEYVFFIRNGSSTVYQDILVEQPSRELLSRLGNRINEKP